MILLFILLQFSFPPLPIIILSLFFFFFCTYSSSTLFSPSLSLSFIPSFSSPSCCWFSSYHPRPFDLLFYLHLSTKIAYFFQCCWYMYLDDCSSFSPSWILLYFTFFTLLLVFHLLLLSLFFPFISPSHSFILLFLYLPFLLPHSSCFYLLSFISITVYSSFFSYPSSSLPLFFLLYSLLSIFSVPQSPLLPPHSPSFFLYFQCPAFSSLSFSSYFYFSFPLHSFMILLFILLQFSFPPLPIIILSLFFFFFFVLILLLLCFLLLSLCPSFPLSHLHPAADFLHITLGLLTYFFIYIYPPK